MAAQSSKPSARQIRRAFGPEAVAMLETQTKQVASIASAFVNMERDIIPRLEALERAQRQTFWQRLKGLF